MELAGFTRNRNASSIPASQFASRLLLAVVAFEVIISAMAKKEMLNRLSTENHDPGLGERVYLDPALMESLHRVGPRHYLRLVIFLILYTVTAGAAFWLARDFHGNAWVYLANIPFYLLAAASLHGISLFTHEGVHGSLSRRPWWNRALSIVCAQPVLQNYSAYKVLHLKHHNHLGEEGDPDHYANYTSWTWLEFAMHWGRLIIGYPVYIV
ncbi:MAG: fatty acid desaturase, partial [Pedosphaera sp.]|nr:fatty acid desaturase [Pedosphaera sp.]